MNRRAPSRALLLAIVLAAGCGGTDDPAPGAGGGAAADAPAENEGAPGGDEGAIDACALLTDDEVRAVLGSLAGRQGTVGTDGAASSCQWSAEEDPVLHVGAMVYLYVHPVGSAPGDRLEGESTYGPMDPVDGLGEGARFSQDSLQVLEFAAGERLCALQMSATLDDLPGGVLPAAIELATIVRQRLADA